MTTTTTTTKAPAASKAITRNAPKPSVEVSAFTVTEPWVMITTKILAEDAEGFRVGSEHIKSWIFKSYASSMSIAADSFQRTGNRSVSWWDIRTDGNIYHSSVTRFKKRAEIQLSMKEAEWIQFLECCKIFDSTPDEMICAAFATRALGIPGHRSTRNEYVTVSVPIPASEIRDFRAYIANSKGFKDSDPVLYSIRIGTRRDQELSQVRAFNKAFNGVSSNKSRLARIKKLMKSEPCETLTFEITRDFLSVIQTKAKFYGISPEDHCVCCLSYHAALWRKEEEKRRPKSPFEIFERGLAVDSRKSRQVGSPFDTMGKGGAR